MQAPADRLRELHLRLNSLETLRADRVRRKEQIEAEIASLLREGAVLEKVELVLQQISARVLGQSLTSVDRLLTAGLKVVFDDQDLSFQTRIEKYRGKTAVSFDLFQNGRTFPITTSFGGGVLAVTGLLLRVVTITTLGLKRILFLDETLAHLSDQYHENASKLLRKLCHELDFTVVMVTHQPAFAEHADIHYLAAQKNGETILTRSSKTLTQDQRPAE